MLKNDYDVIIIGTGAGGGTLAHKLSQADRSLKILILERGSFLPREKENWDAKAVFEDNRYHTDEVWMDTQKNQPLHPGTGYWVGGNTKVYGAALFRFREKDFEDVVHEDGLSPSWPLKYADFEPYYAKAEQLYNVHGQKGIDPTEPFISSDYPAPAVSHEPVIQQLFDSLVKQHLRPFPIPLGVRLNEADPANSLCIRCNTCDGYPCLVAAKSDSEHMAVRPALEKPDITLLTEAKVIRINTASSGSAVESVDVDYAGETHTFKAGIIVVSCGAINSAALLLNSANERFPDGLANSSGLVGRHLMLHNNSAMLAVSLKTNSTVFQKTLAVNDFYWGDDTSPYPMGHIQLLGKSLAPQLAPDAPFLTPGLVLDEMAHHSIDWWLTTEDLPVSSNGVFVQNGQINLDYTPNNTNSLKRLQDKWIEVLRSLDDSWHAIPIPTSAYFRKNIPLQGVAHQSGTCRFGTDPTSSVLNLDCRTHDLDNLYVVDGSFFPSMGAVNPSLTIMANALRVGEHLLDILGCTAKKEGVL